ncbi:uncharacterized protein LOC113359848 [Papaver somniferum]|uniref:uncharacterized protein LOC113359848 n=1 Tax=Papaver somniferum TaxID=3469 RepID=UPI000E6F8D09|nr:uncharacterized protein LOC113359848 [Papaver somniferum]
MKIIAWNVQGCGNPFTQNHLNQLISIDKPGILFLSETKYQKHLVKYLLKDYPNTHIVDPIGLTGGLDLAWVDGFSFEIVQWNINMINVLGQPNSESKKWLLTCFYGSPYLSNRNIAWDFLTKISEQIDKQFFPWILLGDLNMIFSQEEKLGGLPFKKSGCEHYHNILSNAGILDIGFKGYEFTWNNHREGSTNIQERLDIVVVNAEWNIQFPKAELSHFVAAGSDYISATLSLDTSYIKLEYTFKFYDTCQKESSCVQTIKDTWFDALGITQ